MAKQLADPNARNLVNEKGIYLKRCYLFSDRFLGRMIGSMSYHDPIFQIGAVPLRFYCNFFQAIDRFDYRYLSIKLMFD
jgi:hypothetical protein